jgi:hypothetical protein
MRELSGLRLKAQGVRQKRLSQKHEKEYLSPVPQGGTGGAEIAEKTIANAMG